MRQLGNIAGAKQSGKVMILAIVVVMWIGAFTQFVLSPNPGPSTNMLADIKTEPYIFVQNGSGSKVLLDPMEDFYMVHLVQGDIYFRKYSNHKLAIPDTLLYGDGESMMIDAVFDSLGYIHCTWSTDAYGGSSVMYMKTDSDGNVITEPTQLSAANTYIDQQSRIATNSLGQAYVVWSYYQGTSSGWPTAVDVLYAKIDSDGTIIFTQSYVAPPSWATGYFPHLLVDNDDNLHIVYQRGDRIPDIGYANTYLHYKKFAADGTTVLVADKRYDATHFVFWVSTIHMTLDSLNSINLVFSHSVKMPADGGAVETYYMKIDINGDVLIGPNIVSDDDGQHSTMSYLATDAYDNNYVFWADEKDGNSEIYYSALDTDGFPLIPPTRLTDTPEFSSTFSMAAVFNSTNDCYWSYWQLYDGTYVIYPVDQTLIADAGPDQEVNEGQVVWFDASNSIVPEDSNLTYEWDFNNFVDSDGDGNFTNDVDASGSNQSFIYGDDGDYNVTLNVTAHSNGLSGTDTVLVTVANLPPTIVPFGPFSTNAGFPLNLDATSTDPGSDDLSFRWDWGDGSLNTISIHYNDGFGSDPYPSPLGNYPYSAVDAVQHTYMFYGIYALNLTVEDDDGGVALYSTTVTVGAGLERPFLYIDPDPNGDDVVLHWITPSTPDLDHYLIYRSTSQTAFDFDTIWVNTSTDINPITGLQDPLYTMWIDRNVTNSGHPEYRDEYYYTIRSVNIAGNKSTTSNTVGYYIMQFNEGLNTFSLPLEPFIHPTLDDLMTQMGAATISWLDNDDEWLTYPSVPSPPKAEIGEGYVVEFYNPSSFVFTGEPSSMIIYRDGFGFDETTRDDISTEIDPSGNIDLSWAPIAGADKYYLYISNIRHGFHTGTYNVFEVSAPMYKDLGAASVAGELYYLIVPHNATQGNGSSTYSIGVITMEFNGNAMFGLPLKPVWDDMSADWYCEQIPNSLGIVYLEEGIWKAHFKEFPEGVFDTIVKYGRGYELSVYNTSRFSFFGW